jgi:hypothetical protein
MTQGGSSVCRSAWAVAFLVLVSGALASAQRDAGTKRIEVANAGFKTPESILHDAVGDVYLVSNINGTPSAKDNNGFISRVSPDGQVQTLKWIEGGQKGVTLSAPKGMAIHAETLYVSDIDCVRGFNRMTGAPSGDTCVAGATFLNDVETGSDGTVYVSDSGIQIDANGMKATGTDAVYRIGPDRKAQPIAKGKELQNPNGLVATAKGLIVVTNGGSEVFRLDAKGARTPIATLAGKGLDGVVRLADDTLLVSSWESKGVYQVTMTGQSTVVFKDINSPADIGFDAKRKRLLIPVFLDDRLVLAPLP